MLKGFFRLIVHTGIFLFLLLPLMIVGAISLLFVCPFMPKTRLQLPVMFKWFDNVDSYIGRDTSVYQMKCMDGWWSRYCYIAWRNPINYFDYQYMGLLWDNTEIYTKYDPADDDVGDGTRAGFRHIEVIRRTPLYDQKYYEYYWIYQYPFAKHVCFRFRLGWKIGSNINNKGSISQWVYVISPWHNYTGK